MLVLDGGNLDAQRSVGLLYAWTFNFDFSLIDKDTSLIGKYTSVLDKDIFD